MEESLQLTVIEGQVGRGAISIDLSDIARLNCQPSDIVLITGARTTAAKIVSSGPNEREQQTIQMDSQVRQNSASGLGERVTVRKAKVHNAEKVTLLPLSGGAPIQESDLQYISRYLIGLPVTIGDLLRVGTPDTAPREFLVISTTPSTPSYTLHRRTTGKLSIAQPPQLEPESDVEAVLVQPETIVRVQMRGATSSHSGHVSYEDIGGLDKELQRIREVIEFPLKYPAVFDRLGVEPPMGILLYGPPGTGKTLIARAVSTSGKTHAAFFIINGPELIQKSLGETESRLRSVFQEAQKRAPSVIFIDELDSLAPKRAALSGEFERRVVGQLLALLDGLVSRGQVIVLGATNRVDLLDPALRRPGRFDYEIALPLPDLAGRLEILRIYGKDLALANTVDFERLAQLTPGFAGADLVALCREAAMTTLRRTLPRIDHQDDYISYEVLTKLTITMADFEQALEQLRPRVKEHLPPSEQSSEQEELPAASEVRSVPVVSSQPRQTEAPVSLAQVPQKQPHPNRLMLKALLGGVVIGIVVGVGMTVLILLLLVHVTS
jgi:transitional endoplasmic reticulum ATPase